VPLNQRGQRQVAALIWGLKAEARRLLVELT
jgi:hypothetical protein